MITTPVPPVPGRERARRERQQARERRRRWSPATRRRHRLRLTLIGVVVTLAVLFVLIPVWYVVVAAFDASTGVGNAGFWPDAPTTANFAELGADPLFPYWRWLANSLAVSLFVAAMTALTTTMSAYAFSRFRFRGRRGLMKAIVVVEVFPNILALVAIFLMVQQIGQLLPAVGLDRTSTLALVYLGGVLGGSVWLMKGYIDSIPKDLDESAMIDGAGPGRIFASIMLPLVRPMVAVVVVLSFVGTYGELLLARVLLKSSDQLTLPVGLFTFISGEYNERWGIFAAGALIAALPALLLFYLLQDWLVRGLTQGAVKS